MLATEYIRKNYPNAKPFTIEGNKIVPGDILVGGGVVGRVWDRNSAYLCQPPTNGAKGHVNLVEVDGKIIHQKDWYGGDLKWTIIREPTFNEWGEVAP